MTTLDQAELNRLHDRSMELAGKAKEVEKAGGSKAANYLWKAAWDHERRVADQLLPHFDLEPSRGIIFRSAASLALRFGDTQLAERYAAQGLAGSVNDQVRTELRELLDEVRLVEHMQTMETSLQEEQLHVSMTGSRVAQVQIDADLLADHVRVLRRIVVRLQEMRMGFVFRRVGKASRDVRDVLNVRYAPASNGVFGYNLDVYSTQMMFSSMGGDVTGIAQGTGKLFEYASEGRKKALLEFCNQDLNYYRFFVNSITDALPDGRRFDFLSLVTNKKETFLKLHKDARSRVRRQLAITDAGEERIVRVGKLLSIKGDPKSKETLVQLVDEDSSLRGETFSLPGGLTSSRLAELWDQPVKVIAYRSAIMPHPRIEFIDRFSGDND